jgi:hypothetical protein
MLQIIASANGVYDIPWPQQFASFLDVMKVGTGAPHWSLLFLFARVVFALCVLNRGAPGHFSALRPVWHVRGCAVLFVAIVQLFC